METDGQRALQFVRSTPGVTTALVGMKQLAHVDENLRTARIAPAPWERYSKLFQSA
jgi:aryl-alcohol dehydrogenase-like predicted oxidoreductase